MQDDRNGPRDARGAELLDADCWHISASVYSCLACGDGLERDLAGALRHQRRPEHTQNAADYKRAQKLEQRPHGTQSTMRQSLFFAEPSASTSFLAPPTTSTSFPSTTVDAFTKFLEQSAESSRALASTPANASDSIAFDIGAVDFGGDAVIQPSFEQQDLHTFEAAFRTALEGGVYIEDSDDDVDDGEASDHWSDVRDDASSAASETSFPGAAQPSDPFFPWRSNRDFSLDTLMHLQRSVFSERQLDILRWSMEFNGVSGLPSVAAMKEANKRLQRMCGIETVEYMGRMGHRYSVNSLRDIIAQETANPRVAPHLQYLPHERYRVAHAFEARRWLEEIDPHLATPMIRCGSRDFYVFEPATLTNGSVFMPVRWFVRNVLNRDKKLVETRSARGWNMTAQARRDANGLVTYGWTVDEFSSMTVVNEDAFSLPMSEFTAVHASLRLPSPTSIFGSYRSVDDKTRGVLSAWTHTDPKVGNPRRGQAHGHVVRSFPIWLYCDDTSGNQSKKWNKHNSFLFTAAGLPRHLAQQEYNVHFLSTSNSAPVPEMLDGIIDEIEKCQSDGIWAYDCHTHEIVLLIPFVLGLLGDNPMQSEFACHIGLKGRYFCRVCWVFGRTPRPADENNPSDNGSDDSDAGPGTAARNEPAQDFLARMKRFVKVGPLRSKSATVATIREIRTSAFTVDGATAANRLKTENGVKDTFLQFFFDKVVNAMKGKRGAARRAALQAAMAGLPSGEIQSAIWRLKGLDPHLDTPVEVLHVILLGIVKYFWRDAVKNQCKAPTKKRELIARLDSFDVSGLGIAPLRGSTLVNYAGSLVGRDFRALIQAAPFVLPGLVSAESYRAWVALAALVPCVWQPAIERMDEYVTRLTVLINNLLAATAEWSPRWFNKPKFHILLHLPEHVRRFGPAILFATEAFESFNAVIRAKSVHSNRQAPSRDIALAFAQGNRIRHLLSGGWFVPYTGQDAEGNSVSLATFRRTLPDVRAFLQAGAAALLATRSHAILRDYLGMREDHSTEGTISDLVTIVQRAPGTVRFKNTMTYKSMPTSSSTLSESYVQLCLKIKVDSGDMYAPGSWCLARCDGAVSSTAVQIAEILLDRSSSKIQILARHATVASPQTCSPYLMPPVRLINAWSVIKAKDICCPLNVQHDCVENQCTSSGLQAVQQERQVSGEMRAVVVHKNPEQLVLNTAKMRDAADLQPFTVISAIDLDGAVRRGVVKELRTVTVTEAPATT